MNLGLCIVVLLITATMLVVVPMLVLPRSGAAAAVLLLCAALATPFHGALLHEAIHGRLLPGERANRTMGRALAASFGVAFEVVRFGHLSHHRFNRHALDRPDVLEGDRPVAARIGFYAGLLGGMYAFELAATLMTLLPRRLLRPLVERLAAGTEPTLVAVRNGVQRAVADVRLSRARVDCAAAALLYGAAIFLYGDAWPLLVAAVGARGMIVSLLDNAAHYGTPAVPGAPVLNLRAPRLLSLLLLNQNLHGIHHRWPGLAWHALPRAFAASGVDYDGSYVRAVLRQLRGPRQASTTFDPASARA